MVPGWMYQCYLERCRLGLVHLVVVGAWYHCWMGLFGIVVVQQQKQKQHREEPSWVVVVLLLVDQSFQVVGIEVVVADCALVKVVHQCFVRWE